jgi:hypothetical protein
MLKNIVLVTLLIFTMSCGYEPIYSKKNMEGNNTFSITELNFIGNRVINIKIKEKLSLYLGDKEEKKYKLKINSKSLKTIISKDLKGDPSIFNLYTEIIVQIQKEDGMNKQEIFKQNFKYNNIQDKFELKNNEKQISKNMAEIIAKDIIYKLSKY